MTRIFISYRRTDSQIIVGRIYDRLEASFGRDNIFKDVENIPPGKDFRDVVQEGVKWCDVMLVIIGPEWVSVQDEDGQRRLDQPDDFVRIEVKAGLEDDTISVVPVLVKGASLPRVRQLPEDIRELSYINALTVRNDPDFNRDIGLVLETVRTLAATRAPTASVNAERDRQFAERMTKPRKPTPSIATQPTPPPPNKAITPATELPFWRRPGALGAVAIVTVLLLFGLGIVLSSGDDENGDSSSNGTDAMADNGEMQENGAGAYSTYDAVYVLEGVGAELEIQFSAEHLAAWHIADLPPEGAVFFGTEPELVESGFEQQEFPPPLLGDEEWDGPPFIVVKTRLIPELNEDFEASTEIISEWFHEDELRTDASDIHRTPFGRHQGFGVSSDWLRLEYNTYAVNVDGTMVRVDTITNDPDSFNNAFEELMASMGVKILEEIPLEGMEEE